MPRERNLGEPFEFLDADSDLVTQTFTHAFNEQWSIRQWFNADIESSQNNIVITDRPVREDGRTLERNLNVEATDRTVYAGGLDVTGKFETWGLDHTLLMGGDYYHDRGDDRYHPGSPFPLPPIDIFNPVHGGRGVPVNFDAFFDRRALGKNEWYGFYFQDQIELPYRLYGLAGFRYDDATVESQDFAFGDGSLQTTEDDRVSPRGGLLWRPLEWFSAYGSYVENFGVANFSRDFTGKPLSAETAQQWELGVKTELMDGRFSATVAYFDLTRQNIAATDTLHPENGLFPFSRAIGEAESRGVELDFSGELLPGWNLIGNYAYTDAVVTKDARVDAAGNPTTGFQGQALPQIPRHAGRLWTTYTLQSGDMRGLTMGGGVTVRDQRPGDRTNSYRLPGYATADLMLGHGWKMGASRVKLQFNIDNLLDHDYFVGGSSAGPRRIIPAAPRTFLGSVRVEF